jgi:hypothetical protein
MVRWEVQHFVFSMQRNRDTSCDPTSKIYLLDEKLEGLHDRMDDSIRYDPSGVRASTNPVISSRIFSLNYLYHLCLCYLHSAVVPMLSCGMHIPNLSRKTLQLAAEQARRHSSIMVEMTEKFLVRKGDITKLWPIVGYGAYVCAAIQLRCFLAFRDLSHRNLERVAILLRITGELKNYWENLQPLVSHYELAPMCTTVLTRSSIRTWSNSFCKRKLSAIPRRNATIQANIILRS